MSHKSDADSESDFDSWLSAEYWSISNGSKSLSNACFHHQFVTKFESQARFPYGVDWFRRWTVAPISSILFDRLDIPISIRERLIADSPDRLIMRSMVPEILSVPALRLDWSCSDSKVTGHQRHDSLGRAVGLLTCLVPDYCDRYQFAQFGWLG